MRKSCVLRITVVEKCLRLPAGNCKTTVVGFMAQREDNGFQKREQAGARSPILPVLIFRWIIAVFCSRACRWKDSSTAALLGGGYYNHYLSHVQFIRNVRSLCSQARFFRVKLLRISSRATDSLGTARPSVRAIL